MPRRKGALFLPLDVGFPDDDRIVEVGERPAWLYLCMALAVKRLGTDGLLTTRQIDRLHVDRWPARLDRLVQTGLVVVVDTDVYALAGWFQHNDPIAIVQERRAKDAERKRVGRQYGVRTVSEPTRDVEKRREKKSSSEETGLRVVASSVCSIHPTSGRRADGECASCRVDRLVEAREAGES